MSIYDKPAPFDKPQTYDGEETELTLVAPAQFAQVGVSFSAAARFDAATGLPWQRAESFDADVAASWGAPPASNSPVLSKWQQAQAHNATIELPWDAVAARLTAITAKWRQAKPHDQSLRMPWGDFVTHLAIASNLPWHQAAPHDKATQSRWGALAAKAARTSALWRRLIARGAYVALPWGQGTHYRSGYDIPNGGDPNGTPLTVPILPVYTMIPTITAVVIAGGADLKPLSCTITGDIDSFCWTLDLQIPAETFSLVNPEGRADPVEIRVTVNTFAWSFAVTSYSSNRKFKSSKTYSVRGSSRSLLLAEPFAPKRTLLETDDFNAAQLADHELESTGWTLVWDSVDWAVPGGTFSYSDLTPIAAIQQIAASVGATIETNPDALTIHVRPRYPVKPWAWGDETPYAILPAAILDSASGELQGGTNANGIFVYAQNSESGALVRITGTDGAVQLPMVVDPLTVEANSQRERGTQALAAAGISRRETLDYPLFPAPASPGLIPLRSLLDLYDENGAHYMAQVMGIRIGASKSGGATSVRQTLTVERQFRDDA